MNQIFYQDEVSSCLVIFISVIKYVAITFYVWLGLMSNFFSPFNFSVFLRLGISFTNVLNLIILKLCLIIPISGISVGLFLLPIGFVGFHSCHLISSYAYLFSFIT